MDQNLCKVCAINESKYVCPRCNLLYCSVKCYQSRLHLRCSEEFYKENVVEYMSTNSNDQDDANKMKDILNRIYNQDQTSEDDDEDEEHSLDSDDEEDIAERLKSVSLDDADSVWEKLSQSEKQAFVDLVQNGCSESIVPLWEPWWSYRKSKQKIEIVEENASKDSFDYATHCPTLKNVPPLSDITKRPPAACVTWNIINVIGSYSYVIRYFNGEPMDFILEAVDLLITVSGNLRDNRNYDSYESAIEEVAYEIVQCPWVDGSEHTLARMRDDVQKILHGPEESNQSFYLQAALSDIINLLEKAKGISKKTGNNSEEKTNSFSKQFGTSRANLLIPKEKLKLYMKKIEYYLMWVKSCVHSSFS
ncbi:hypothetical protein R5R35_000309 [Gryllus longicercus]|uniref:HIT-type domain-containing protein n=1 Tax=Gryllus longicercus TaxID=2509291 RepID=A0AAN9WLY4_9ORTH